MKERIEKEYERMEQEIQYKRLVFVFVSPYRNRTKWRLQRMHLSEKRNQLLNLPFPNEPLGVVFEKKEAIVSPIDESKEDVVEDMKEEIKDEVVEEVVHTQPNRMDSDGQVEGMEQNGNGEEEMNRGEFNNEINKVKDDDEESKGEEVGEGGRRKDEEGESKGENEMLVEREEQLQVEVKISIEEGSEKMVEQDAVLQTGDNHMESSVIEPEEDQEEENIVTSSHPLSDSISDNASVEEVVLNQKKDHPNSQRVQMELVPDLSLEMAIERSILSVGLCDCVTF